MRHLILKAASFGIALAMLEACDLDQFPQSSLSPENSFKTETELKYYINGIIPILSSSVESGIMEKADNGVFPTLPDYLTGKRSPTQSAGSWDWTALRKINIFLKYSSNCPDEEVRTKYNAIARCLRAYFYYDKLKTFGGVPWYDKVLEDNDPDLYKPRDSREMVAEKILEDIDYAIKYCPSETKLNECTKWTALAIKSRFCLFEGTFRKYHNLDGYEKYLKECVSASKEMMSAGVYKIDNTGGPSVAYRDLFIQPSTGGAASKTEVILARSYSIGLGVRHGTNYYINNISGQQMGLDKALIDSYLMKDGTRFTDREGYDTLSIVEECMDRDPRLAQTIRTPKFVRVGNTSDKVGLMQEAVKVSTTGYMPIKYVQDATHDSQTQNDNDIIAFRYAEVLLNYAEAKAELGELTQNDINISIKYLRDRVGMPNLIKADANAAPDPYLEDEYPLVKGPDKGVILEIRRERRIELVMEGLRYDDLMRYKAGELMTRQFKGIYVPEVKGVIGYSLKDMNPANWDASTGNFFFYLPGNTPPKSNIALEVGTSVFLTEGTRGNKYVVSHGTKTWDESRDYLAPIPQEQITINPAIEQNPNW
ncbi:MAG: RagB/SusD family nutrient uptake outer membrane protein [Candidatus Cryptobacteroides sp.]